MAKQTRKKRGMCVGDNSYQMHLRREIRSVPWHLLTVNATYVFYSD